VRFLGVGGVVQTRAEHPGGVGQRRNLTESRDRLAAGSRLRGGPQALLRISPEVLEAGERQRQVIDNPGHDAAIAVLVRDELHRSSPRIPRSPA
jgi:hypothetical protein